MCYKFKILFTMAEQDPIENEKNPNKKRNSNEANNDNKFGDDTRDKIKDDADGADKVDDADEADDNFIGGSEFVENKFIKYYDGGIEDYLNDGINGGDDSEDGDVGGSKNHEHEKCKPCEAARLKEIKNILSGTTSYMDVPHKESISGSKSKSYNKNMQHAALISLYAKKNRSKRGGGTLEPSNMVVNINNDLINRSPTLLLARQPEPLTVSEPSTVSKPLTVPKLAPESSTARPLTESSGIISESSGGVVLSEGAAEKRVKYIISAHENSECSLDKKKGSEVCSPPEIVKKMEKLLEDKGVKPDGNPVTTVKNLKDLLDCKSEDCILKHDDFVAIIGNKHLIQNILKEHFKPSGPANSTAWLSNTNIDDALDQLALRYKGFYHIPYQMRDFASTGSELAKINLSDLIKQKYNTFGVVINTDTSQGNGIHWFCIFIDARYPKSIQIEYFNSSGKDPLDEISVWMNTTMHELQKEFGKERDVSINKVSRASLQLDSHSCGVWCLAYIWLRLEGIEPRWFTPTNITDNIMMKMRQVLFRSKQ